MKHSGTVFPTGDQTGCVPDFGLTIRDYFAAKALPFMLSEWSDDEKAKEWDHLDDWEEVARFCYAIADAMVKERET